MNLKTKMEKTINASYKNIGGMVVCKSGEVVYEKYNNSERDTTFHIFSVTKSIISILIGIAIDKGYIENINQRVVDFFPEYFEKQGINISDANKSILDHITIKNMLTMTVPYKQREENYREYFSSQDWVRSTLELIGGKGKVGEFRYAPVIGADILSGILVKATGQSVLEFATENLFEPLGIKVENNITFSNEKEQLEFYKSKDVKGWVASPTGVNTAGWGLNLTARDMAKIGELCLCKGVYNGQQIVSRGWIEQSTSAHIECKQYGMSYGYLWWIIEKDEGSFAALGDGGNVIYVNPKKELVISIASTFEPKAKDRIKLIKDYIEPVFI